jgi:glycine/serine hydroxymethyltransferase
MREVASCIAEVLKNVNALENAAAVRVRVDALTSRFPLYDWKR